MLHEELPAFGVADLRERLLRGGLPPALLADNLNPEFFNEWLDSYFARDVQELFHLEKRAGFLRLLELLFRQSGGMLDVTKLAAQSQVSRPTVLNWLEGYQTTHTVHLVRPFTGGGRREIVAQPKVFGFDTGLVCHARKPPSPSQGERILQRLLPRPSACRPQVWARFRWPYRPIQRRPISGKWV